ncbi:hypothetical protein [Pseudomonas juntendi]|uniref:hypothetical protein n=1 Tax=Pseudomonas juntendi TaxID=2666183 RepID=UPI001F337A42|nr:hypothetical protein [Pseudomonas juntendi]MCO7055072.1 hypothetical protein [Pseudomonas juntendi]UJM10746.1 hypothetical protein L1P09_15515 [Pseudomonas juntendi]UXA40647.1 hypothetical protein KZA81_09905 [Pseudomonas juntendi]
MNEMSKIYSHMTVKEEQEYSRKLIEEDERQRIAHYTSLKAADHHTHCRDCGRFVDKSRWLLKASAWAQRGQRPLCAPCFAEYDFDY